MLLNCLTVDVNFSCFCVWFLVHDVSKKNVHADGIRNSKTYDAVTQPCYGQGQQATYRSNNTLSNTTMINNDLSQQSIIQCERTRNKYMTLAIVKQLTSSTFEPLSFVKTTSNDVR